MKGKAKKRALVGVFGSVGVLLGALHLAVYALDHDPVGRWRLALEARREIRALETGGPATRARAAERLGPLGAGRDDARRALEAALLDPDRAVAAAARLSLRFFHEDHALVAAR